MRGVSAKVTERQDRVTATVRAHGSMTAAEVAQDLGLPLSIVQRDVAELRLDGELVVEPVRARGALLYRVPDRS